MSLQGSLLEPQQRLHPAANPQPACRGRCPHENLSSDSTQRRILSHPAGVAVDARTPRPTPTPGHAPSAGCFPPRLHRRGAAVGSSRRHLGPGGLQLLGDATGPACERRGARSPAPALFPPPRHLPRLPLRKRQLRGAGAASRYLPRPPRRRPAPQPGRGAPRLPVSTAGGSARLPPSMNIMDFNVKKLAADAGTFLSRAVQVRRRRLRPGWWRRGGRGEGWPGDGVARGTQACRWARPGAPAPPAVSASLAPTTAGPRPARRVGTRPRASSARDTLGSPRGGGLGAPAGEAGHAEHLGATPTLPCARPRPPGRVQPRREFPFPAPQRRGAASSVPTSPLCPR